MENFLKFISRLEVIIAIAVILILLIIWLVLRKVQSNKYKKEIKLGEVIKTFLYVENGIYTVVIKSEDEKIIHSIIKLYN